ncbi:hypothetical protein SAMN04489806_3216 [Paramicrobacterium humi]|uniref:YCII-related domain-containing protein n=1 Tax=Paramicrobacterium humi TaxID=640635 RepID=A0A1H4TIN0_9MICO|nr:hypothetical protein [Microbacterium humi]SEC55964.1 hypothetical protein SAMN04489806_3216 [Microbacterium humi]
MRYLLLLHSRGPELRDHSPEWMEEATAFLARFDDELAMRSELEWSEVLAPASRGRIIGADGTETTAESDAAAPVTRVWVVRVADAARALALGGELARRLGARVDVRECLPSAQMP